MVAEGASVIKLMAPNHHSGYCDQCSRALAQLQQGTPEAVSLQCRARSGLTDLRALLCVESDSPGPLDFMAARRQNDDKRDLACAWAMLHGAATRRRWRS